MDKEYDICFACISDIATDARTINIAKTLAKNGYSVCIIATGSPENDAVYANSGIKLFRIPLLEDPKAWKRWLKFNKASKKLLKTVRSKIFWAADVYSLFIARRFAKKYSAKLFYDSREIFSALGALHSSPLKQKIISRYEKKWISDVDKIIVSGPLDADYLRESLTNEKPYYVIMNVPPYKEPDKKNLIRDKYDLSQETKILIYQGMILEGRGIMPMVKALPYLDGAVFCIFGSGNYRKTVLEKAKELKVDDRVIFHGLVPYDELHDWTSSGDVGITITEPISLSYELALPNKLFEYCMARIPMLVSDLPAQKKILEEFHVGELISTNASPEETAGSVKRLFDKDKFLQELENAARKYSYESQEKVILEIMR